MTRQFCLKFTASTNQETSYHEIQKFPLSASAKEAS